MANKMDNLICLGVVVAAHGIKGEVKVKSFTNNSLMLDGYGNLSTKDGLKSFNLKVTGTSANGLVKCKIKDIDTRNDAEALVGTQLFVSRDLLPKLEEEEFYQADLIGLDVVKKSSGEKIGTVCGIYNFGAGDILEIKPLNSAKTEMIPFTKTYVPEILLDKGYILVCFETLNFAPDEEQDNAQS